MKPLFLFLFAFQMAAAKAQFISNICDSVVLTKAEYEKCIKDTLWSADLEKKINGIIQFKTSVLPKYRAIRKKLVVPPVLQLALDSLRKTYEVSLLSRFSIIEREMDRNQYFVQPRAYLSSLLSFQLFHFYPDVYAVLLNEIHLEVSPKISVIDLSSYRRQFDRVLQFIPAELFLRVKHITGEMNKERNGFPFPIFQGEISEDFRNKYRVVDFLIWNK